MHAGAGGARLYDVGRAVREENRLEIEFLPPNAGAFGASGGADFVGFDGDDDPGFDDDAPRSPWLAVIATLGVTAMIGVGVVAAAPWDSRQATPPTTTTPPTSTTTPRPTTTAPRSPSVPVTPIGFVLDDPGDLVFGGAWSSGEGTFIGGGPDRLEIWATPDASRHTGRWLAAVTMVAQADYEEIRREAVQIDIDGTPSLISTDIDGVVHIVSADTEGDQFEIAGSGFDLGELMRIAETLSVSSGAFDWGDLVDGALAGTSLVIDQQLPYGTFDAAVYGSPQANASWIASNGLGWIDLVTPAPAEATIREFVLPTLEVLGVDPAGIEVPRPGRSPVVVTIRGGPGSATRFVARWDDGGHTVQLSTEGLPVEQIIDLVPQVRLAGAAEWKDLVVDSQNGIDGPFASSPQPTPVASGELEPGQRWEMALDGTSGFMYVSYERGGWGGTLDGLGHEPAVHRFSSRSATFVLVTSGWPNPARRFRVSIDGGPAIDHPMETAGDSTIFAGGFAVTGPGQYTVELLDADGNVVAVL